MTLLAVAGSLIGNARWVSPWMRWHEPPVIWAMLVGSPSAGKSPAISIVTAGLRALEARVRADAERERKEWAEAAKLAEAALRAWEMDVEAAAVAGRPAPPRPPEATPPAEPHLPRLTVNDTTTEALGVILGRQPRGTLMLRDAHAGFLGSMGAYKNGSGGDRGFWLEAWGGGPFSVERLSREPGASCAPIAWRGARWRRPAR